MTKPKPKTAPDVLLALKGKGSWPALSTAINKQSGVLFNPGYLHQIASGKRPASNKVLRALGLPLNAVPVMPCPRCGEVHEQKKTCPTKQHAKPRLRPWRHLNDLTDQQIIYLLRTRKEISQHAD